MTDQAQSPVVNASYADLKKELIEIASVLEKYPEALKPTVFKMLMAEYRGTPNIDPPLSNENGAPEEEGNSSQEQPRPKEARSRKKLPDSGSIDPDLNLRGGADAPSFEKFCAEKRPNSNPEFTTVAVYYITKVLKKPTATLDQVWTCYKDTKRRTPDYFRQSLTDTKNKTGYVKIGEDFQIEVTSRGENFVEHDLPPKDQ